jgi:hypothetical protein
MNTKTKEVIESYFRQTGWIWDDESCIYEKNCGQAFFNDDTLIVSKVINQKTQWEAIIGDYAPFSVHREAIDQAAR